jgi:ABC-2 type transport system permease protein
MGEPCGPGRLPGRAAMLVGQVGYQVRLLTRTPRALWLAIFAPAGLLALRLGRISHPGAHPAAGSPVLALVAGLAVFGLLNTAFLTHAAGLVAARQDGVLRRWRLSPLPAGGYFAGRITATVLLAVTGGLAVVVLGMVLAGLRMPAGSVVGLVTAFGVGAAAWAALGTAATIVVPSTEATFPVTGLVYLPVALLSGVLGPFPGEPGWLAGLLRCLPAEPLVDAVTAALRDPGGRLFAVPGHDLAVLAGWAVAGLLVCLKFFRWAPQVPARSRRPAGFRARDVSA